jgi:putative acetyltransferase
MNYPHILIRPEIPADYAHIADLQVHAFGGQITESLIVTLLRQRRDFDPELSLVVEVEHRIVGHVLLSPYTVSFLGQSVKAVNIAPIGVDPLYQGQGIGDALVREGHRIARTKGYVLSFLVGYDTYYPRFGYKPAMYGLATLELQRDDVPPSSVILETRVPGEADCTGLYALSLGEEYHVDFALQQGESLVEWVSPNPNVQATVYLRNGIVAGYTRVHKNDPDKVRMFLAVDKEVARAMVMLLMGNRHSITLPLHPYSKSAAAFTLKPQVEAWNSAMACSLAPSPFDDYDAQLQAGKRPVGRVIWPVAFDFAM